MRRCLKSHLERELVLLIFRSREISFLVFPFCKEEEEREACARGISAARYDLFPHVLFARCHSATVCVLHRTVAWLRKFQRIRRRTWHNAPQSLSQTHEDKSCSYCVTPAAFLSFPALDTKARPESPCIVPRRRSC